MPVHLRKKKEPYYSINQRNCRCGVSGKGKMKLDEEKERARKLAEELRNKEDQNKGISNKPKKKAVKKIIKKNKRQSKN